MVNIIRKHRSAFEMLSLESAFLVLSVVAFLPLLKVGKVVWSTDNIYHWERITELTEDLKHLQLPQFNGFSGYRSLAVMTFYPWLTWLPLAFLRMAVSPVATVDVYIVACLFIGLNVAYLAFKSFNKSKRLALAFTLFYVMTALFTSMYEPQGENSELLAEMFVPLVFFGWLKIVKGRPSRMLLVGMALMVYTHLLSTFLMGMALLVMTLAMIPKLDRVAWKRLVRAGLQFTLVSAFEWLPILVLMTANPIMRPEMRRMMSHNAVALPVSFYQLSLAVSVIWSVADLAVWIWTPFQWRKLGYLRKVLLFTALFVWVFNLRWLPWGFIERSFLNAVQFPFRLSFIGHVCLSYLLVTYLAPYLLSKDLTKKTVGLVSVFLVVFVSFIGIEYKDTNNIVQLWRYHFSLKNPLGYRDVSKPSNRFVDGQLNALIQYSSPKLSSRDLNSSVMKNITMNWDYSQGTFHKYSLKLKKEYQQWHETGPLGEKRINDGFVLHLSHSQRNVSTPVMAYHTQRYVLYANGRRIPSYHVYHGAVVVPHLSKGTTRLTYRTPLAWYRWLSIVISLLGCAWAVLPYRERKRLKE